MYAWTECNSNRILKLIGWIKLEFRTYIWTNCNKICDFSTGKKNQTSTNASDDFIIMNEIFRIHVESTIYVFKRRCFHVAPSIIHCQRCARFINFKRNSICFVYKLIFVMLETGAKAQSQCYTHSTQNSFIWKWRCTLVTLFCADHTVFVQHSPWILNTNNKHVGTWHRPDEKAPLLTQMHSTNIRAKNFANTRTQPIKDS